MLKQWVPDHVDATETKRKLMSHHHLDKSKRCMHYIFAEALE